MSAAPITNGTKDVGPFVLRASAIRIRLDDAKTAKKQAARRQAWQDEAWDIFDEVPEVKNLTWYLGNAMSKLKIFAAVLPDDDPNGEPIPVTDPGSGIPASLATRANAELQRLKGPLGGQAEILREMNMNLEIAGEGYLVGRGPRTIDGEKDPVPESFDIKSIREVTVKAEGEYWIKDDPFKGGEGEKLDETRDSIIRIYQRHPGASALADCHMRGVISECELLVLLTNELKAEAKSRQSAGFMTMPNELSYGPPKTSEGEEGAEASTDPFEDSLMAAIVTPIEDPSAPESVYPLLIRGQAEFLQPQYLRHFSIARDTTNLIEQRIEGRVKRVARGLNAPVEATIGLDNTTFSNAYQVDKDAFDDYLQPRCGLICDALTVGFLRPNLLDGNAGDPTLVERIIVWYSADDIIESSDPVENADHGLETGAISMEAWRQYKGFTEDDAPDALEQLWASFLRRDRLADPALVKALLAEVDIDLTLEPEPATQTIAVGPDGQPVQTPPPPGQPAQPGQPPAQPPTNPQTPATPPGQATVAQLLAAMILRRGGKKLQASAKKTLQVQNLSQQLAALDRELIPKLITTLDRSLTRVLERAGNRLKARGAQTNALLRTVHPMYAAATLGPQLVLAAGLHEEDLVDDDAWIAAEMQYIAWVEHAQKRALGIVSKMVKLTPAQRSQLAARQRHDLEASWLWLADQLHALAQKRLYEPDPNRPARGEFDPTVRVPAGMVRQALARAGGATNIVPSKVLRAAALDVMVDIADYSAMNGDAPLGGIGAGELVSETLSGEGMAVQAYEWTYGPAMRMHPFEEHEVLDGEVFTNFDAEVLAAGDWIGDYYFPGDHDGCLCLPGETLVSAPGLLAATRRWYEGDLVEITTASGNKLAGTPNHPILTPQGWVPLGLLHEGSDVVSSARSDLVGDLSRPYDEDAPTCIRDVFGALDVSERSVAVTMPISPEDFHGDGTDGEVEIVWADRLLRDGSQPSSTKQIAEPFFMSGSETALPLAGERSLLAPDNGTLTSPVGVVPVEDDALCVLHASGLYAEGEQTFADGVSVAAVSNRESEFAFAGFVEGAKLVEVDAKSVAATRVSSLPFGGGHAGVDVELISGTQGGKLGGGAEQVPFGEDPAQSVRVHVDTFGSGVAGSARTVTADRIVHVSRRRFLGHVYNLHTESSQFIAAGIVTHNCDITPAWAWPEDIANFEQALEGDPANEAELAMVEAMREPDGGFTIDPRNGTTPIAGYAVAVPGHESITPVAHFFAMNEYEHEVHGVQIVHDWLRANADTFDTKHGLYDVGGWHSPKTHEIMLDPSQVIADRAEALASGIARNQQAIADLKAIHEGRWGDAFLNTGGTGVS